MTTMPLSRRSLLIASAALVVAHGPIAASARQATPAAIADDLLLETTFAPDELPGDDVQAFFYRLTVPPGETLTHLAGPYCGCGGEALAPGVGLELVRSGTYGIRLDAPFRVHRADGGEEEAAAGEEVVLGAGDAGVFGDYAAAGEIGAAGEEPAVVVGLAVVSAVDSGPPAPDIPVAVRGEQLASMFPATWAAVASDGPVALRLRRLELPPGAALGPYAPAGAETLLVEAGEVDVATLPPGAATPAAAPFSYPADRAMPFLPLGPGVRRLLTNPGEAPAVLLVASVAPAP